MLVYRLATAILALLLNAAGATVASVPAVPQAPVPVKVTVTVRGRTETLRGEGRCAHEARASLYGSPAGLWLAEYPGAGGATRLSLTCWRFAAAAEGEQFSLDVRDKAATHRISTVRRGKLEGSGSLTFRPTALGGRFEIAGKAHDGANLQVTIECARFGGITAVGG